MAHNARVTTAAPRDVFALLAEPETYPQWLIGAANIRDVEPNWPSPGSRFHHTVGVRPFALADSTEVLDVEPDRSLSLHVRARPFISGIVHFELLPTADGCVITMLEEPAFRLLGNLARPLLDPATHQRNHRSLQRLARMAEEQPVA